MQKTAIAVIPLLLLAGCARNQNQPAPAAAVGYAPASGALKNPEPVAPPAPEPVAASEPTAASEPGLAPERAAIPIPRGTPIHVRLDETVDTRSNRAGDVVHATLSQPITVDGRTAIPSGTRFTGHVTMADSSGRLKGRAHIGVALDSFHLNGRTYRVSTTSIDRASAAHKKRNGILIGGATGLGAAVGALAGGAKGALIGAGAGAAAGTAGAAATGKLHVAVPAETPLRFTLRSAVEL